MKKNDIVAIVIEDIGAEGEGIGKFEGFTLFVKDTMPGDEIECRIIKLKKNYGYGRLERVIEPSPFRVEALCDNARRCGGCQLMEMDYLQQLEFKENKVKNNLVRIGGFDRTWIEEITEPIVGMDIPFRYRNKAQYPIGRDKDNNAIAGFYAGRTHSIISCTDCKLGSEENKEILEIVLKYMNKNSVSPYDEESGKGLIRHVLIRKGFTTGEIMVCLVINDSYRSDYSLKDSQSLCDELSKVKGIVSIMLNFNNKNTNVIMGNESVVIRGRGFIRDTMTVKNPKNDFTEDISEGITYEISPLSFYQVNPIQVEKLYGIAVDYASLTGNEEVWDICSGIGTITLSMASKAKMVHGIEIVPQAIEDAKKNAANNNVNNVEFICAAAEEYLPEIKRRIKSDVIVMDPPRKGMDEKALEVVVSAAPSRIVYVSCDSATLARDLKYLCDNGYELKRVRCCDMFPQTVHVETVVLIQRKDM